MDNSKLIKISNESAAKAFIRGEFRRLRELFNSVNDKHNLAFERKNKTLKNFYQLQLDINRESLSELLIEHKTFNKGKTAELTEYIYVGATAIDIEGYKYTKDEHFYPLCSHVVDKKRPMRNDGYCIRALVYISEHAMARMITRNSKQSIKVVVDTVAGIFNENTIRMIYSDADVKFEDFVVVTRNCYIPFVRQENSGIPIMKTWVPEEHWDDNNYMKLSNLAHSLTAGEIRVFETSVFNSEVYLSPN